MIYYLQYHNSAHILATAVIYGITLNNANLVTSAKILFNCVKMSLKTVIYKYCFIIFGFLFMEKERLCLNGALEQLVLHGQVVRSSKPFHWWNIFVSQCQYFYTEYLLGMLYLSVYKTWLKTVFLYIYTIVNHNDHNISSRHLKTVLLTNMRVVSTANWNTC